MNWKPKLLMFAQRVKVATSYSIKIAGLNGLACLAFPLGS